ncbi:MAG: RNA methyltransferase [Bacteroidia bacterium]
MQPRSISSAQNPLVKQVAALHKPRERRKAGVFLVEGLRETALAARAGYAIRVLLYCPDFVSLPTLLSHLPASALAQADLVELPAALFNSLAYRKDSANVLACCDLREDTLADLRLPAEPLLLVSEGVEKPGNLGAMLRTADAVGVDAVVVCDPQADLFNPNVIRASLGAFFTLPVVAAAAPELIAYLRAQGIRPYVTYLEGGQEPWRCDLRGACALVMGAEDSGIGPAWLEAGFDRIKIPMRGQVDSMNVSVSAAMLLYEALRQRSH